MARSRFTFCYGIIGGLCALLFTCSANAFAGRGQITGLHLQSCGAKYCLEITAPLAYISGIDGGVALPQAKIQLNPVKKSLKPITMDSTDTFFDIRNNELLIYEITGAPNRSAVYNLALERASYINK